MTIRAALKILKMSKKALTAKYGRTATSKVIDARLTLKEKGMKNVGKYTRKKATQVGMAGKIKKTSGEPSKKEMMQEANRFNPFKKPREKR